jgi:hypothetical protein
MTVPRVRSAGTSYSAAVCGPSAARQSGGLPIRGAGKDRVTSRHSLIYPSGYPARTATEAVPASAMAFGSTVEGGHLPVSLSHANIRETRRVTAVDDPALQEAVELADSRLIQPT